MELKPGYKQTEVGVVPEDWIIKSLGEIATYTNGKAHENSIKDHGRYVVVNSKFISTEGETKKYSDDCFCPTSAGDVLMVMSDVPNGKAIAKCFFVDKDDIYTVNQRICALSPTHVDGKLLFYKLDRNPFYLAFDDGAKQTNLRRDEVLSCPLSIPKSDGEQFAIAGVLGDVDDLLGALEKLIAKKRDLKQAAMQQLLTGQQRLPGFHGEWEVKGLGELFQFLNTAKNPRADLSEFGDVGYIHYGDIHTTPSAFLDCADAALPLIARTKVANIPQVEDGDLVMADASEDYDGIGKCLEIRNAKGRQIVAGLHTFLLRGDRNLVADGFKGYLQFIPSVKAALVRLATGISVYGVSKSSVKSIEVLLPGVDEQTAIAAVLSDMDDELAALEARLAKTRALKQGMMQELLTGKTRLV